MRALMTIPGTGGGAAAKINLPPISTPKDPDPFFVFILAALFFALAVVLADYAGNARDLDVVGLISSSPRLFNAFDYAACYFCGVEAGRGAATQYGRRSLFAKIILCAFIGHLVSNGGGGHARDLLFRQEVPFYLPSLEYIAIAIAGGLVGQLAHVRCGATTTAVLDLLDRVAVGVFVVIGSQKALAEMAGVRSFSALSAEQVLWAAQMPSAIAVASLFAFCSGAMGGVQRDLILYRDRIPFAFTSTLWLGAGLGGIFHIVCLRVLATSGNLELVEWAWVATLSIVTMFLYWTRNTSFALRPAARPVEGAEPALA